MGRIKWDQTGERKYETGVDRGVLYPTVATGADATDYAYTGGVAWNGITAVTESPSGAEPTAFWADNIKYLNLLSAEDFSCTIEAYTYPDEFAECDGSAEVGENTGLIVHQQPRKIFGLCYRTLIGNDTDNNEHGYKIHMIYGCLASPSEKNFNTVNDTPELITFSWSVSTTPVECEVTISGSTVKFKPTAYIEVDSTKTTTAKMQALEEVLYGKDASGGSTTVEPKLPLPAKVYALLSA